LLIFYSTEMMGHRTILPLLLIFSAAAGHPAGAADCNIRLVTDSAPDLTDIESYVRSITGNFEDPQDRAIAIWRWGRRNRHQTRCATDRGRLIWDPVLHFNSYGYMNCGIISALNIAVGLQAGFQGRYIQLGDHTVSELSWDNGSSWHLFDSSMSIFCYNHRGMVASCEEIRAAESCELSRGRSEAGHFYYYHPAPACASHLGPTGWRCASDNPVEYQRTLQNGAASYISGYSVSRYSRMAQWGRRYILNLKPYQSYTRHWRMLGHDSGYYRAARGEKDMENPEKNSITRTVRANGLWEFRPDLSSPGWEDFVHHHENLEVRGKAPYFVPDNSGEPCSVVFKVDGANVITSMKIEAEVVCQGRGSDLRISLSRDAGLRWSEVWRAAGNGREHALVEEMDSVAGHTEALVKFDLGAGSGGTCGLEKLGITTVTQVNRLTLPGLRRGRNRVQLRLGDPVESLVLWPVLHGGGYRETALEERDIYSRDATDSFYQATLGAGANGSPCFVTWRLPAPTEITEITVGARVCNRGDGYVSLQHSWDGREYREFYRKSDGSAPFDLMVLKTLKAPGGTRCAWVRCEFFTRRAASTYNTPGIQDIFIRAAHRPRSPAFRPLEVTYAWTEHGREGKVPRRHTRLVPSPRDEWEINVGGDRPPTMEWVRIRLQGEEAGKGKVKTGYSGGPEAAGAPREREKLIYRWGRNLARNAPYRSSRPASGANGDTGGKELTNGIVVAPTDYFTSHWPEILKSATAGWEGELTIDIDLEREATLSGVRACTHQPNARFCHPARVDVLVSSDGKDWREVGKIHQDDLWSPPGDYEPWELDGDPRFEELPAGGRLAYRFPLVFEPTPARHVRFHFTPLPGRGIGISELEVYDQVEIKAWPGDITLPPLRDSARR